MGAAPATNPPSVFVDSSVLFAACYSPVGSARDLINAAFESKVTLTMSVYVLTETERNILQSARQSHPTFLLFRDNLPYRLVAPESELIVGAERLVVHKDAPIIAAAYVARAAFVATYDRRDLLSKKQAIEEAFGLAVATPQEILASL